MAAIFCCPRCKESILTKPNGYFCQNCATFYSLGDGYVDFIGDIEFYAGEVSQQEMKTLIDDIDSLGYNEAITDFFKHNPRLQDYITDARRADWICHCLGKNNFRCLDIGSGLGAISELLSYNYQEVYSLEAVRERIEFQKRRYKNSNRSNIIIVRSNALELPFQNNYFDLVVCNGVLEWIGMMNTKLPPREAQLSFLYEIRRVLSDKGCLYIGIENRFGFPFLLGAKDHSGLSYTSLLPRNVANFVVRKFGYSGGIYGDKSKKQKEKRGYYTYTYSILGYSSLLRQAGFKFKPYWVFPSYNNPNISGKLDDKIGLKGFIRYIRNTTTRFKIVLLILEKMDKSILGLSASLFTPSFLFYCYKNQFEESFDNIIANNTLLENYIVLSEGSRIKYILYDKKGEPSKVVHLKRYGYHLPSTIALHDKTSPDIADPSERAWVEDWIPGKILNPLKFDEVQMAIEWLINFQNKTHLFPMTKNDIALEVNSVRRDLLQLPDLNTLQYRRLVDDYELYVGSLNVDKTAEHGDFWYGNILVDSTGCQINVIDWEYFREKGDPFYDFVFFIITAVQLSSGSAEEFISIINGSGKFNPIMRKLQDRINSHFGFELNLGKLIPYTMLRFIVRKQLERGVHDKTVVQYKNILYAISSIM
jgi:SAM-dependent methyltransferase